MRRRSPRGSLRRRLAIAALLALILFGLTCPGPIAPRVPSPAFKARIGDEQGGPDALRPTR